MTFKRLHNSSIADRVRKLKVARTTLAGQIILTANVKQRKTENAKYPEVASNPFVTENWGKKKNIKRKGGHVQARYLQKILKTFELKNDSKNLKNLFTPTSQVIDSETILTGFDDLDQGYIPDKDTET